MDAREERIKALQEELDQLQSGEIPEEDITDPILNRMKVRRGRPCGTGGSYDLSEKALAARRENAQKSTGPKTPEGKANCSLNAWKHGLNARKRIMSLGKPCKSTCRDYPCYLVEEGATSPGQQCLDKEYMLHSVNAISRALQDNDLTDLKDVATLQLANTLQVIEQLQSAIIEDGIYMKGEKIDKEGNVIGYELKPNPALLPLSNLLKAFGLTLPDFNITPAAVARHRNSEEAAETLADILSGINKRVRQTEGSQ